MRWRAIPSSPPPIGDLGTGAATPTPAIPQPTPPYPHPRRAGVGRYPGDGRGNSHNRHPPTNTPVPPPPSCRRRPVPRGRARQLPQPASPTNTPLSPHRLNCPRAGTQGCAGPPNNGIDSPRCTVSCSRASIPPPADALITQRGHPHRRLPDLIRNLGGRASASQTVAVDTI